MTHAYGHTPSNYTRGQGDNVPCAGVQGGRVTPLYHTHTDLACSARHALAELVPASRLRGDGSPHSRTSSRDAPWPAGAQHAARLLLTKAPAMSSDPNRILTVCPPTAALDSIGGEDTLCLRPLAPRTSAPSWVLIRHGGQPSGVTSSARPVPED
jgi:hypothetical protein